VPHTQAPDARMYRFSFVVASFFDLACLRETSPCDAKAATVSGLRRADGNEREHARESIDDVNKTETEHTCIQRPGKEAGLIITRRSQARGSQ